MGRRSDQLTQLPTDTSTIQVVERAFEVLRCFAGYGERLANKEIAARTSLPPSTISRLTVTLTRIGQLAYEPSAQCYRLGPRALAMSSSILAGLSFLPSLREVLRDFVRSTPGTVGFVVPDRFHMVYVAHARAWDAVSYPITDGARVRIGQTAAGHAHVAALPDDARASLLDRMDRETPEDAALLRASTSADTRSLADRGYVVSCALWNPHINGVAVPLQPLRDGAAFTLTIGMLAADYDEARLVREVGPRMIELAETVRCLCAAADLRGERPWRQT